MPYPRKYPGKDPKKVAIRMRPALASAGCFLLLLGTADLQARTDQEQQQAKLDAACESAREKKLAPLRKQFVEQCVRDKEQPNRAACKAFYSDYGAQSGDRAPLFYDLPECKRAFEYQNSERQP